MMINMLLEPKLKMYIAILDFIYANNNWTKSSTISEELDVSKRTVQHYFKDIFDLKQQYDDTTENNLSILYLKTKGICIIDYTNNFSK